MDEQAKEYLLKIPFWTKKKNTLEQTRHFLEQLGNPQEDLAVIHVAGTNGKGSVCADLTAVLKGAGYRVGTFVSPHLVDIRERFLIGGEIVKEAVFEDSFHKVLSVVRQMMGKGYCHPTFFEFVFLMAMVLFDKERTDYVVLETGMGGRLDTTNVIARPIACIITSISLDHTKYLGDTIPKIAAEKAGIIKAGVPVIYDDNEPAASRVIRERADELGAPAYAVQKEEITAAEYACFAAPYQARNAALARMALKVLQIPGVNRQLCEQLLREVRWQGRMEEAAPEVWLDGAHNPGGIRAFIEAVEVQLAREARQVQLLFAAVSDKDYGEMIRLLCDSLPITRVTVVHLRSERGLGERVLAEQFERSGCPAVEICETVGQALETALAHRREGDRLYVVGSLYLIGEIKELLGKPPG